MKHKDKKKKKLNYRSPWVTHYLLFNMFSETVTVLFSFREKKKELVCDRDVFRLLFRLFCTISVVIKDQIIDRHKQKPTYAMQCLVVKAQGKSYFIIVNTLIQGELEKNI